MKSIAAANQKGGVGKTTTCRNLTFYSAEKHRRTLAVDLDPQGNFSKTLRAYRARTLGAPDESERFLTSSMLFQDLPPDLKPMDCGNGISLIAADRELLDIATLPMEAMHAPRAALASLAKDYDVCIIDTPPTLGKSLYAALIIADFVVCPCTIDEDATDGLTELFEDIARVQQMGWNPNLVPLGVLATCVNTQRAFDARGLQQLRDGLGDLLLDTVLYERAATKYAKDRAVWQVSRGESQQLAAQEMKAACRLIFEKAAI